MEKRRKNAQKFILITLLKLITVDDMRVDELGVDEMRVDEIGSRRSWNKPHKVRYMYCENSFTVNLPN